MQRTRIDSLFSVFLRRSSVKMHALPFGRSAMLGLLLLGAGLSAAAQSARANRNTDTVAFTLTEAIQYGLDNAVSMRQAVLTMREANERKREVLSRGLPQLNASLGYTNFLSPAVIPFSDDNPFAAFGFAFAELYANAGLELPTALQPSEDDAAGIPIQLPHNVSARGEISQLVFDGAYFLGVKATNMLVDLEAERTKLSEIDLRHNITQAYYTGLVAELRIRAVQRNMDIVDQLLGETDALNEQGFVEDIEVDRLRRSLADLEVVMSSARRDHELALRLLKYTMNFDQAKPIRQVDRLDSLMLANTVESTAAFSPEDRLEYRLLLLQEETNQINVRYNRNEFLPKLTAFASYEQQAQRETFDIFDFDQPWIEIAAVGANLTIPIFDGFYKRSKVEQAKVQLERIRLQQELTAEGLTLEVEQARSDYLGALERLESQRESRDLAERIYSVSQAKYREGLGSSLELTTAQSDFQNAEDAYIGGLYEVLAARANFIKALGLYPTVKDFR
jgi:outer membrane protein TolC